MENRFHSEQINELVAALVQAKKKFKPLKADVRGNYGEYASSDAIKEATEDALLDHGLVFMQHRTIFNGQIMLESKIMHASGQWITALVPLLIPENVRSIDQAYGSATTYQRRYEAYGMLGLGKGDGMDPDSVEQKPQLATEPQVNFLNRLLANKDDIRQKIFAAERITSLEELSFDMASKLINKLKGV